ncbi:NUDIX domain-containing protein [Candidatus Micrarchaeota archaeon]|nr:NUDIX domain-containing protein [Candidatus Micrarchaeota archaeon]
MRPFACDGILIEDDRLLLVRRAAEPFKGEWALPGGRIDDNEDALQCLKREMQEETGLEVEPVMFVGIYSDPERDPRRVIAAAYLVKRVKGEPVGGDDAELAKWFKLDGLPPLCADHEKIVKDALILYSQ